MNSLDVKGIQDAYQNIYHLDENIFEDIVNFCNNSDIFETLDEAKYFANLIIENNLTFTFVEDVLEYCNEERLFEETYLNEVSSGLIKAGLKAAGGLLKATPKELKGLPAKTLVKRGFQPGGLKKSGELLGATNKPALATQTRAIRQARAARKPPEFPKANRYADMLSQKRGSSVSATPATSIPKPASPKSGVMSPSYVAKRGVTDTLATTLALGMGHMAGIKPATNILRQMTQPMVRTVKMAERIPPSASTVTRSASRSTPKVRGAAADPWMQFPKKPAKQYGIPKPSSPKPQTTKALSGTKEPKGLLPSASTSARGGAITPATKGGAIVPTIKQVPSTSGRKPSGTKSTSTGSGQGSGLTHTVRAVLSPAEKSGQQRYPSLSRYDTSGQGAGGPSVKKGSKFNIPAAIGAASVGAGLVASSSDAEKERQKQQKELNKQQVALKQKPISIPKPVTGEDVRKSFDKEFSSARKRKGSTGTFEWTNPITKKTGTYTTKYKEETLGEDVFDIILNNLIEEGYADTNQNALAIMANMSKEWIQSIVDS